MGSFVLHIACRTKMHIYLLIMVCGATNQSFSRTHNWHFLLPSCITVSSKLHSQPCYMFSKCAGHSSSSITPWKTTTQHTHKPFKELCRTYYCINWMLFYSDAILVWPVVFSIVVVKSQANDQASHFSALLSNGGNYQCYYFYSFIVNHLSYNIVNYLYWNSNTLSPNGQLKL